MESQTNSFAVGPKLVVAGEVSQGVGVLAIIVPLGAVENHLSVAREGRLDAVLRADNQSRGGDGKREQQNEKKQRNDDDPLFVAPINC